ncbi:MAG: hypothetical protein M3044_21740, partial [Thermoproteota archaeon]|nr:hypothetical protein [Thermoproteota archaeon]
MAIGRVRKPYRNTGLISVSCTHCQGNGKSGDKKCAYCEEFNGEYVGTFYYNFVSEVKSASTIDKYTHDLQMFADYNGLNNINELDTFYQTSNDKELDKTYLANKIKTYIKKDIYEYREAGVSAQRNALNAIFALYDANQVKLDKEFIRRAVTEKVDDDDEEDVVPYTLTEVKKIFDAAGNDLHYKALIAFLVSSGTRIGGAYEKYAPTYTKIGRYKYSDNFLRIRDFEPAINEIKQDTEHPERLETFYKNCSENGVNYGDMFRVTIYRHSAKKYRYDTYCSAEATSLIKQHWQKRIEAGEPIDKDGQLLPTAPAFRNPYGVQKSRSKYKQMRERAE